MEEKMIPNWAKKIADEILEKYPEEKEYVFAAGISPSGIVHCGNLRDLMTCYPIVQELKERKKKTKFIFSWDNFDRFRKVPVNIPEDFEKYIGMPVSSIPAPFNEEGSYADYFQKDFEKSMVDLGIDIEYRYQTDEYKSGKYDDLIMYSIESREKIAEVLLSSMSKKAKDEKNIDEKKWKEEYYPISIYSQFTNKDNTKVLKCDGYNITYYCYDTKKEDTVDFRETRNIKLQWKVDWAMRWKYEGIIFEPGGHDHASPGSSYDVSSKIAREVFNISPPIFVGYEFIGIQGFGSKMSGSTGSVVSPKDLLEIYEPNILKWLYLRKKPNQKFQLAFDSEIYRQYEEFDREFVKEPPAMPFRQAVAFGDILQWNEKEVLDLLDRVDYKYDINSVKTRLKKARAWLEKYNPDEMIKVRDSLNSDFVKNLSEEEIEEIRELKKYLEENKVFNLEKITQVLYEIPKKNNTDEKILKKKQREFFKTLYNLLITKDTGPRLGTFLCALDIEKVVKLLDV